MEFYVGNSQSGTPGFLERRCEVLKALKDVRVKDEVSLSTRFPRGFKISSGGEAAQFQSFIEALSKGMGGASSDSCEGTTHNTSQ